MVTDELWNGRLLQLAILAQSGGVALLVSAVGVLLFRR